MSTVCATANQQPAESMGGTLKDAMASFTTGVTVVTARHEDQDWGMTCNSFNTVSLDPALVLWSIRRESSSRRAFVDSGGFLVNVLARHHQGVAMQFTRGTQTERFEGVHLTRQPSQRARMTEALAWFDCELVQTIPAGDHDILIGKVRAFGSTDGEGLVYSRRQFGVLQVIDAN